MAVTRVEEYVEAGAIAVGLAGFWGVMTRDGVSRWRHEWIAHRRSREATRAALVAAQDREVFDPEYVQRSVLEMLDAAAATWSAGGTVRADELDGALRPWATAHFHGQGSTLHGSRSVSLLRVISREQAAEDRVSVRVRFAIRHGHEPRGSEPQVGRYDERWTLAHDGPFWRLVEFDARPLADELLRAPQIRADYEDTARLAQQSLEELARDSLTIDVAGLTDPTSAPAAQLRDLSLINERFALAFIETTLEQLVEAWEEATTGTPDPLRARATDEVAQRLLAPATVWRRARLILRDPALTDWTPTSVDTSDPAEVSLTATISTVRYLVGPDGAVIMGSGSARHQLHVAWTIRQTDQSPSWQLVDTSNPAADIAGAVEVPARPATGSPSGTDAPPTWTRRAARLLGRRARS